MGGDYQRSQFNRAVQAKRQPGSLFKPFIYLAAFEARHVDGREALTPATIVEDRPLTRDVGNERWMPRNYNGLYYGKVRLREALERSLNAVTITIGEQVGLRRVIDQAKASGIESQLRPSPATLLGASEVSLLEITAAYGTLAREGKWLKPYAIRKVEDGQGHVLFEESRDARQAASPQAAFLVTSILQGTVERGYRRLGSPPRAHQGSGRQDRNQQRPAGCLVCRLHARPDCWCMGWCRFRGATSVDRGSGCSADLDAVY